MAQPADRGLFELWTEVQQLWLRIQGADVDGNDAGLQADVRKCIELVTEVLEAVDRLALWSANEDADDLSTKALGYILAHYYMGELQLLQVGGDRLEHCLAATRSFRKFLSVAEALGVVPEAEREYLALGGAPQDGNRRRQEVIRRALADKEAKARQAELLRQRAERIRKRGADAVEAEEDDADDGDSRALLRLALELSVRATLKQLDLTEQELPMLEMMARRQKEGPAAAEADRRQEARRKPPPPDSGVFQAARQLALGPQYVRAPMSRSEFMAAKRADVFQPGWAQPTMTIEESIDEDIRTGKIKLDTVSGKASEQRDSDDSDSETDNNEHWRAKREWDEFKDANPRGSGNRYKQG